MIATRSGSKKAGFGGIGPFKKINTDKSFVCSKNAINFLPDTLEYMSKCHIHQGVKQF